MNMQGMSMPGMKTNSCIAKDGAYKPGDDKNNKNCTTTDYKVSGNTVTWKMKCTGKDAMTGSGEMTKTADAMKGVFKMATQGMDMTQTMDGKRVGTCDAGAEKQKMEKTVADAKAQGEQATKKMCEDQAKREAESGGAGGASMFEGKGQCVSYKPQLCEQARAQAGTYAGYIHYVNSREGAKTTKQPWGWVLSECGINLDQILVTLCDRAVTDKQYRFIGARCPIQAKELSAKNCAGFGMDYTADMAKPNAGMCYALRSKSSDANAGDGNAARASRATGQDAGAKSAEPAKPEESTGSKLKKMLGF
jgi:hypothetical protein